MSLRNYSAANVHRSVSVASRPRTVVLNPGTLLRFIAWKSLSTAFLCGSLLFGVLFCRPRVEASFVTAPTYPAGRLVDSIAIGDLNGDGIPDIVAVNDDSFGGSTVSVLLGNGDGTFRAARSYAVDHDDAYSVALGDFNGDGHLDMVVAVGRNGVSVLLGNGDGTFQAAHHYAVSAPNKVVVGDFNGDGIPDIVTASWTLPDTTVSILLGNGDGTFQPAQNFAAGQGIPYSVAMGDFNGDGHLDLVLLTSDNPGMMHILLGNGDGTFQGAQSYAIGQVGLGSEVAVGDLNGDGNPDLAITFSSGVSILLGNGDGTFQAGQSYATGNAWGASPVVRDMNGDGKLDLVIGGGSVTILLGNGDGSFQAPARSYAAGYAAPVAVADFNGDGIPDVAVTSRNGYGFVLGLPSTVSILLGKGDGTFQAAQTFAAGRYPASAVSGDFNGDGILDLAVANGFSDTVSILLGNGDGTFRAPQSYTVDVSTQSVAVGDFNGDGHLDLAVAGIAPSGMVNVLSVSILLGNGDGSFQAAQAFPVGDPPTPPAIGEISVAVGDFNGDGKVDIVTTNLYQAVHGPILQSDVRVFLGNGDGTFQAAIVYPVDFPQSPLALPDWVAVADFNADGIPDLAVTSKSGVSILLGNGNGTFQAARTYAAGPGPVSVTAADFNGDGVVDLAVLNINHNGYGGTVSILLGNGDGTFQAPRSYAAGTWTGFVAVGDFNRDGFPDLVVTNGADLSTISILLGNGDGTFQAAQSYAAGASPSALAVGDFNGDGYPDLAVCNLVDRQGTVTILLNAADWGR